MCSLCPRIPHVIPNFAMLLLPYRKKIVVELWLFPLVYKSGCQTILHQARRERRAQSTQVWVCWINNKLVTPEFRSDTLTWKDKKLTRKWKVRRWQLRKLKGLVCSQEQRLAHHLLGHSLESRYEGRQAYRRLALRHAALNTLESWPRKLLDTNKLWA